MPATCYTYTNNRIDEDTNCWLLEPQSDPVPSGKLLRPYHHRHREKKPCSPNYKITALEANVRFRDRKAFTTICVKTWFNFRKVEQPPKSECQHHLLISLLAASVICLLTRQIPGAMEGRLRSWAGSDVLMWNNQCVLNRVDSSPLVTIASHHLIR